ncbi:ras-related protein Rab-22A-like [Dysidea avara]|uniref:ras-related protein Rab-22A-like n=1 Tax=Dysidea avara TaxID=196820 RepID=UPI00331E5767
MALVEIKLCVLGEAGVGKTCLVHRFVTEKFDERSIPTVGAAFMSKRVTIGDRNLLFHIWDTAGQEKYRGLAPMYYRGAAAVIVAYDITDERTFRSMQSWIDELHKLGPDNLTMAITGTKCDKEKEREVSFQEGQDFADKVDAIFLETSALSGTNISELFTQLGRKLPLDIIQSIAKTNTVKLNTYTETTQEKKPCPC